MASSHQPLLSSPSKKKSSFLCKALLYTLSLATIISLTSILTLHFSSTTQQLQPSDLCTNSPNLSSCHSIVSSALTTSPAATPLHVLATLLDNSLLRLTAAAASINVQVNGGRQQAALADCAHLFDLSRDRLAAAAAAASASARGAHVDARTLLSAVLTNHITCSDLLEGSVPALNSHLDHLIGLASASLAVLNSVAPSSSSGDETLVARVADFPSWVSRRDRKLLEASPAVNAATANVVVAKDGSGKFETVQEAVNAAPDRGKSRYVIYVKKGTYKENVNIGKKKTNLMIVGDGQDATVITGSLNYVDGTTTFNSATLAANADGFILQDLKVENTAGAVKHQAVALRVSADKSVINRCKIEAYQDTLYAHTLRQFYRDSTISGTIDFIFGNAAVVIQNCSLVARQPLSNQQDLYTAQGRTDPNQNTGTSIQSCQLVAAADLDKAKIPTYLGRPWKEYSRTVVMQSTIGDQVSPLGWAPWDGDFALTTLFYGEYQNKGPGAGTAGRVKWPGFRVITDPKVASLFTVANLIQGGEWLGSTGVAFTEGLCDD